MPPQISGPLIRETCPIRRRLNCCPPISSARLCRVSGNPLNGSRGTDPNSSQRLPDIRGRSTWNHGLVLPGTFLAMAKLFCAAWAACITRRVSAGERRAATWSTTHRVNGPSLSTLATSINLAVCSARVNFPDHVECCRSEFQDADYL